VAAPHLQLDRDGRIRAHRDDWDPAEEVYERQPILGALMRWLRRRGSARQRSGGADSAAG
jgi:hypothetical protein